MSTKIIISALTMDLIRAAALAGFRQTGKRRADGTWEVPLSADTAQRLHDLAFPGETMDDTIQRLFAGRPQ